MGLIRPMGLMGLMGRMGQKGAEGLVERFGGEAHDIEIGAAEAGACCIADPLLNTVGAGLIEGTVTGDIEADLVVGQGTEGDVGSVDERGLGAVGKGDGNAGEHLMGVSAQEADHRFGLGLVGRFAEHAAVDPDDGVGRDEHVARLQTGFVGICFRARYINRYIASLQRSRIGFVGINVDNRELHAQSGEEFFSSGAFTTEEKHLLFDYLTNLLFDN